MFLFILLAFLKFSFLQSCSNPCSNHGSCITDDECVCERGYFWSDCRVHKCHGVRNDNPFVCSGNGDCVDRNVCECFENYSGKDCSSTTCFELEHDDDTVCSGNGKCIMFDTCECKPGYGGVKCDEIMCFGLFPNDPLVCSGRGVCGDANVCECSDNWKGKKCELKECYGRLETDPNVCGGGGICVDFNLCDCSTGYQGSECETRQCFSKWGSEPDVCSGHGKCLAYNHCDCEPGYLGANCEYRTCHGKHAVLVDTFEALGGDLDTVNDAIWEQSLTFAKPSSGGCGAISESGRSLFFTGTVPERVAVTQTVAVVEGAEQRHSLSFHIMMATGETGCEDIYLTDEVWVEIEYVDTMEKFILETLEPKRYANRAQKVTMEFYPEKSFRVIISQPKVYDDRKGQFSIDTFIVAVEDHLDIPCNANGLCMPDGTCECFPLRGTGPECLAEGCQIPIFNDISPTDGPYEGGTEVTITGCFEEDVTKCRFYASWRDPEALAVEVMATRSADGTKLTCITPPLDRIQATRMKIDVHSESAGWYNYDMVYFYYFEKDSKKRAFKSSQAQSGVLETSGVFWEKGDVANGKHQSLDLEMRLYFLKQPQAWQYVDPNQKSSFNLVYKFEKGVMANLLKFNTQMYELDNTINPNHRPLFGIDVNCYFHGTSEQVPCYSYIKRKKIDVTPENTQWYCDGWYEDYTVDPEWNGDLPACPRTLQQVRTNGQFTVEPDCSEKWKTLKTCNQYYADAFECYVSIQNSKARRCCYDTNKQIILHGCSSGRADFCAAGELCYEYDAEHGDVVGKSNHYDADVLAHTLCQNYLGDCDSYEDRRPSRGDDTWYSGSCKCSGDPHCTSWDGTYFHYYGECSYWMLRSRGQQQHLVVQAHFKGQPYSRTVALAFKHVSLGTPTIQVLGGMASPQIKIDGTVWNRGTMWNVPDVQFVDGGGGSLTFIFTTGEKVVIQASSWGMNFYIQNLDAYMYFENTEGICGYWNEQTNEDLVYSDRETVHNGGGVAGAFGVSWRVAAAESLFAFQSGDPNVCGPSGLNYVPPEAENPQDLPWVTKPEKDLPVITQKCNDFLSPDLFEQCLYDSFYEDEDTVMDYTIQDDVLTTEFFKENIMLPAFSIADEIFEVRRLNTVTIPFELVGGQGTLRDDLTLTITKIRLEENFEHELFSEALLAKFSAAILERNRVEISFSDPELVDKLYEMELELGDEVYGYDSTAVFFQTFCESGMAGDECTEIACFDIAASDEAVCSGNGECTASNTCVCNSAYVGENCQWAYVSDAIQQVEIVLPDQYVHHWEKIVLGTNVKLPVDFVGELDVYFEWSLEGEQEMHDDIFLTPRQQEEIAIRPYSFEPYTEHTFKVVAKSVLGDVVCRRKLYVLPSLPVEFVQVTPVDNARNQFDIDCSRYLFKDKIMTYSYLNPRSGKDTILMRTMDPIVRVQIPSTIDGQLTIRVRVFHFPTKKEIVVEQKVTVKRSVFTVGEVQKYCKEHKLFGTEEDILDNPNFLTEVAYLVAWLNEFDDFETEVIDSYRHKIFNALMAYSSNIDLDYVDEYILILHGLTINLNKFPAEHRKGDTGFEVGFSMILDQFLYQLRDSLDERLDLVEATIHDSYSQVLFQMLELRRKHVEEKDVLAVIDAYESLMETLVEHNKVEGEMIVHENRRGHYVPFTTKQHRLLLESMPLQLTKNIELKFPIYPEESTTDDITIKTMAFQQNPFMGSEKAPVASEALRIRVAGKQALEYYTVTIKGDYSGKHQFRYYEPSKRRWVDVDMKPQSEMLKYTSETPPAVYVTKKTGSEIEFDSRVDNAAYVVFDTTPYGLIVGFSIAVPLVLGSICLVLLIIGVVVGVYACIKYKEKKIAYGMMQEEMKEDMEKQEKYEEVVGKHGLEGKVMENAAKLDGVFGPK